MVAKTDLSHEGIVSRAEDWSDVTEFRTWGAHERVSVKRTDGPTRTRDDARLGGALTVVALSLLARAATVHAQCAWVLWALGADAVAGGAAFQRRRSPRRRSQSAAPAG
jgi:hypothetical protein